LRYEYEVGIIDANVGSDGSGDGIDACLGEDGGVEEVSTEEVFVEV
jgi:hypothetical protein